jgi:hypothetical protein
MKNLPRIIIYTLLLSTSCTLSFAQATKGQWMLGGSAYINPNSYFEVSVTPTAAYMISNRFAIGGMLQLSYVNGSDYHFLSSYLIPTVRYYFGKSRTQPFIMAGFGPANGTALYKDNSEENYSEFSFYGGAALGLSHLINNNIALEVMVGHSNSNITVFSGTFVNFGFQIFLNKKSHEEE